MALPPVTWQGMLTTAKMWACVKLKCNAWTIQIQIPLGLQAILLITQLDGAANFEAMLDRAMDAFCKINTHLKRLTETS